MGTSRKHGTEGSKMKQGQTFNHRTVDANRNRLYVEVTVVEVRNGMVLVRFPNGNEKLVSPTTLEPVA
jgi:hypothetical protein